MRQTITEKIIQDHAVDLSPGHTVRTGDIVNVRPFHVMTHDNTGAVIPKFRSIGATRVADPQQPVFTLDHNVQDTGPDNLAKYGKIEAFAKEQCIVFHPAGTGIGHQLMIERGFVHPGRLVVASDSHSNMYGALSALGTPIVRTDAAAIWATSTTWWQVPRSIKVTLTGKLQPGAEGKDVIIALCGLYHHDEVLNAALEFHGSGIQNLSMSERMTIANMTTEWGALVGWFPFDAVTAEYLRQRQAWLMAHGIYDRLSLEMIQQWEKNPPLPDPDAVYAGEIQLDLGQVTPQLSGPDTVFTTQPIAQMAQEKVKIHKAYLLSCVNGRLEDLVEAAEIFKGKQVAPEVELYLAAASAEIEEEAQNRGIWQILLDAGAIPLPPGCGACIGLGHGTLKAGEVGISATNRNFKGRMGSREAQTYLASPTVVASSAVAGYITMPQAEAPAGGFLDYQYRPFEVVSEAREVNILPGFPETLSGRVLLLPVDNLNTDGIYGKEVTYRDDLSPEQMAGCAMANYDPNFQQIAQAKDIIVAGRNFGTGSSREQAATALKYRGIQMVIAASFSQTYLRNAFNNAFICLESPPLAEAIRQAYAERETAGERTILAGEINVDFRRSLAIWNQKPYPLSPMGPAAQELILYGGLESLIRKKISQTDTKA